MIERFFFTLALVLVTSHSRGATCPSLFDQPRLPIPVVLVEKADSRYFKTIVDFYPDAQEQKDRYLVFYRYGKVIGAARVAYPALGALRILSVRTDGDQEGLSMATLLREIVSQSSEMTFEVVTQHHEAFRLLGFTPRRDDPTVMVYRKTVASVIWHLLGF